MNSSVRKIALAVGLLFLLLFANLNYVQLARSRDLSADRRNRRNAIEEEGIRRGAILAADGTVLAESVATGDERFRWRRRYPLGSLFGHLTGYYTSAFFCDSTGLEGSQNLYLSGRAPATTSAFTDELLGRKPAGRILKLTVEPSLQRISRQAFGSQRGGAAVLDTSTGAVLALFSNPSYDPNVITRVAQEDCGDAKARLERDPGRLLLSRAFQVRYAPGSTFKIVTAAAGLQSGMSPTTTFPNPRALDIPDTDKPLHNFGRGLCRGGGRITLEQGFTVSCNTTFAQVALRVGSKRLVQMAERFGLDRDLGLDVPAIPSCMKAPFTGNFCDDPVLSRPFTAFSGIGQGDVRVTPLQMAVIGAAVGNGGFVLRPHVVSQVLDSSGKVLVKTKPERSRRIYSARTQRLLRRFMVDVALRGTAARLGLGRLSKGTVGAKTGTAETGIKGAAPHAWLVAWGPGVAVAVVVEDGGSLGSEATGAAVAGPIARRILEAALGLRGER